MTFPPAIFTAPLEDARTMEFIYLLLIGGMCDDDSRQQDEVNFKMKDFMMEYPFVKKYKFN